MKALGLLLLLVGLPTFGAAKRLTLVFQGDNGGEVAPCG